MQCTDIKAVDEEGARPRYLPELAKTLFISDTPGQEKAANREFAVKGLALNVVSSSRYLGAYIGPQEE